MIPVSLARKVSGLLSLWSMLGTIALSVTFFLRHEGCLTGLETFLLAILIYIITGVLVSKTTKNFEEVEK